MAVLLSETYSALKEAGVSDERARAAAEEIAGFEARIVRLEVKMNVVIALNLLVVGLVLNLTLR